MYVIGTPAGFLTDAQYVGGYGQRHNFSKCPVHPGVRRALTFASLDEALNFAKTDQTRNYWIGWLGQARLHKNVSPLGYVVAGPRGMLHRANYTVNVRRDATADYPAAVWALRSDEVDSILPDWSNLPRNHRVAGTGKDKPASINVGKSHVHVVRGVGYTAALRSALVLPKPAHAFKVARALLSDTYFVVVEIADILDDPTD